MNPRDAAAAVDRLHHLGEPNELVRREGFAAGWAAAVRRLKAEQHKVDTIGGAIALLENGTS